MNDPAVFTPAPANRLAGLPPYTPIEPFEILSARLGRSPDEIVKLDANENPYGPSRRARQALAGLAYAHIYPDPESRLLRNALAGYTGVPVGYLLAGAGADELLDLILRVMLEPNEPVLSCPPTFGMYPFLTRVNAGMLVEIPRRPDFSLDLEGIRTAIVKYRPRVFFLASPNNPDGSLCPPEVLDALLDLPVLVVLDEAYVEFTAGTHLGRDVSRITQVPERQNLIVLRTFSKWAGLAGLRLGYGAFPQWLIPTLWKAKQPYNVNVAASAAAIASLNDLDELGEKVELLQAERVHLASRLAEVSFLRPYPSQANYILCRVVDKNATQLKDYLIQEHGIFIRYYSSPGLQDHIRISIGKPEDTRKLIAALKLYEGIK